MKQLPIGSAAPDFQLQSMDGRRFQLSEAIAIAPVVLAFFKVHCPTCQFTFPYLQRIYSALADGGSGSGLKIIGVSQDDPKPTREFASEYGIHFDLLIDEHPYTASSNYRLEYVPGLFIVDSAQVIQLSDYGFSKDALNEIARLSAEREHLMPPQLFTPNDGIPATRPG